LWHVFHRPAGLLDRVVIGDLLEDLVQILDADHRGVVVRRVTEALGAGAAAVGFAGFYHFRRRALAHDVALVVLHGVSALVLGDQHLVDLLARADPDDFLPALGGNGPGEIRDRHGRDLGDEDLAAFGDLQYFQNEVHALVESDPEARHTGVGDGETSRPGPLLEEGHHGAAAPHDVSVAHDREDILAADGPVDVGGDEQLVRAELCGAVQINGVDGLVCRQGDDTLDVGLQGRVDDVHGAQDVRLDELRRVVLRRRHLLKGCGVDNVVHTLEGPGEPVTVPHIAEKITDAGIFLDVEALGHLELLELVAAEDDEPLRLVVLEHDLDKLLPEGSGPAGDENIFPV